MINYEMNVILTDEVKGSSSPFTYSGTCASDRIPSFLTVWHRVIRRVRKVLGHSSFSISFVSFLKK